MPEFKIRIVEKQILVGEALFTVEADTAEAAAEIVYNAHEKARATGSEIVELPNGQRERCYPDDVSGNDVTCFLVTEKDEHPLISG